jgi:D-tagatose-1,6-bisphosphate aldolase subunit GatZ/KbaZ
MRRHGQTALAGLNPPRLNDKQEDAGAYLKRILANNRDSGEGGTYAVCSAHTAVLEAAIHKSFADGSILHVESTSSQVNQFGGYTRSTPKQFAEFVRTAAAHAGLAEESVLLGGDHLGPFPWRGESCSVALKKACELVQQCVIAGYRKIHLDASMACADDPKDGLPEGTIAERAAIMCRASEEAYASLPAAAFPPLYVIGTEVPAPGGESIDSHAPSVTTAEHVHRTVEAFRAAFYQHGQASAWERVIAVVVQPGVDFGADTIFDYHPAKAHSLSDALSTHPRIVFEAHSTDYQSRDALAQMVRDHFAILKVGPWLTFAYREAILALSSIERELFSRTRKRTSCVRDALEIVMLRDPTHWKSYYRGDEADVRRDLIYGLSDRCRYYWNHSDVQQEIARLFENLESTAIPLGLLSQFLPSEYEAIRAGELALATPQLIEHRIRRVLDVYADACSTRAPLQHS